MQAKSIRKKYLRFLNFIFATVGIFFGFTNSVVAQYGAPMNLYRISGNIKSLECEYAIPNIKLTLQNNDSKNKWRYPIETKTDENGNYTFVVSEYMLRNKFKILAEDVDGKDNGEYYNSSEIVSSLKTNNRNHNNFRTFYNKQIDIYMKAIGVPPCEQEQHDSIVIPPEEQYSKNDNPNSIENIVDAISSNEIIVYPNPNKGRFTVRFSVDTNTKVEFRLYDSNGKLILNKKIEKVESIVEKKFNIEQMPVGIYYLSIIINDSIHTKKIIVN
ncbi:radical SAM-associated putative lipoprotein [Bacteroidota bacterium]